MKGAAGTVVTLADVCTGMLMLRDLAPPILWGRQSRAVLADLAKPAHFLRYWVAVASKTFSIRELLNE